MFTGIVEQTGLVRTLHPMAGGLRLEIDLGTIAVGTKVGDSISVNGICLTVSAQKGSTAVFDVSPETLQRTTVSGWRTAQQVNLERAMRADGRFGGHFVQGHVDGVGRMIDIRRQGPFALFRIEAPAKLLEQMFEKGSVAVDGISLTIAGLDEKSFTTAIIPATLAQTAWKDSKIGDLVNIETDILVKIVRNLIGRIPPHSGSLNPEILRNWGYSPDGE